jgi:paraquat-inducible protein B
MTSVQQAADELGRSAAALRAATADDSATVQGLQRALADVSRAARAVRELSDAIEQQPQSCCAAARPHPDQPPMPEPA